MSSQIVPNEFIAINLQLCKDGTPIRSAYSGQHLWHWNVHTPFSLVHRITLRTAPAMPQHKLIRVCICRDIVCVIVFDLKVIDGYGVSSSFIRSALKASNYYWAVWACTPAFSQEFAQQCFEVHKQHNHSCKHMNRQWLNRLRNMQCWLTEKVKNIAEFQKIGRASCRERV